MTDGAVTRRYRATIAYDGTGYHGFQRQTNAHPTVQGALEEALRAVTQQEVTVIGAGRTDAGVHASGQVIAVDVSWRHGPQDLKNAMNATLPDDVVVRAVEQAEAGFHPRFDARSRTYRYRLWEAPQPDPVRRGQQWHVRGPLDEAPLREAVASLHGEHDFGSFGTPPQGENTRRTVYRAEWTSREARDGEGCIHEFVVEANAFLYKMVRRLVGTLHEVGIGKLTPDAFGEILVAADPTLSSATAPPQGLTLAAVNYDD